MTIKLSYSCSPNMHSLISKHNKKILNNNNEPPANRQLCNCRVSANCPIAGHCLESAIIYKATVSSSQGNKFYIGATEQTFKKRYPKHKSSFEKKKESNATSLSKYIWTLKDSQIEHTISWEIVKRSTPYKCGTRFCELCLTEKFFILKSDPEYCINKNSELMQKCRHNNKFKLKKVSENNRTREHGII